MYDKRRQQLDTASDPEFDWVPHTRVEVRRLNWAKPVANLAELQSPLSHIKVLWPGNIVPPKQGNAWNLFLDSRRLRGEEAATSRLPPSIRKTFSAKLKKSAAARKPDSLWGFWPEMIKRTGLLDFEK